MNCANDIVSNELQQQFVDLRDRALAPHKVTEHPLDGAERRFDVAPLMIDAKERFAVETVEVKQLVPCLDRCFLRRESEAESPDTRSPRASIAAPL